MENTYEDGFAHALQEVKQKLLKMMYDNQLEMYGQTVLTNIYYYTDIDATLKNVYCMMFYSGIKDIETIRRINKELEEYGKKVAENQKAYSKPPSKKVLKPKKSKL